jgi:hypothetical protein
MTERLFIATEKFDPSDGEKWENYTGWAKLPNLEEVVSLDALLCPHLIKDFTDDDWDHIVNENYRLDYFYQLDYLLSRVAETKRRNILGLYRNPIEHILIPPESGNFEFKGYDLIEEMTQISALTNCGGFPDAFSNDELNHYGIITDFARAVEIRRLLKEKYPDEDHANCELYAIWRLKENSNI